MTPVEARVAAIAADIKQADGVTADGLIGMLGSASYAMIVLVLSVLNMLPGPPGYGGTIAIIIISTTIARLRGVPLRLTGKIGQRVLPATVLARMVKQLVWLAGLVGKVSRPRLEWLTGPRTELPTGWFILFVSLPMLVPIPFINAIPNVGIAMICVSRINQDGLGVLLGIAIALIGIAIAIAAIWGAAILGQSVMGW